MDTEELVRSIAERKNTQASLIQIDQILKDAFAIITERLAKKETIHLSGFGSFALSDLSVKPLGRYVSRRRGEKSKTKKRKGKR